MARIDKPKSNTLAESSQASAKSRAEMVGPWVSGRCEVGLAAVGLIRISARIGIAGPWPDLEGVRDGVARG